LKDVSVPLPGVTAASQYEFGPYRLDCDERALSRDGEPVHLPPKTFDLLVVLLSSAGHLVQKSEIRKLVWPDTFVDDVNIAQHISILRKALHEGENGCRYIETVPRLGYRFGAIVCLRPQRNAAAEGASSSLATEPNAASRAAALRHKIEASALGAALLIIVGAIAAGVLLHGHRHAGPITSIAVLRLANLSGDASQDYFADGMTEALITDLSKLGGVQVISRGSVMRYKDSHRTAAEIGRELNVDAVVQGAVLRAGGRVRVTAQLVRTATNQNVWAEKYERDIHDVVALQDELAASVAKEIQAQVRADQAHSARAKVPSVEAQEAYLKGRYFWNRRTETDYLTAISWFEEAVGYDPDYAAAYAGLADAYALLGSMPNGEIARAVAMPRAKAAAEKALELNASLADAHASLAFVKMHYEWDWAGAEHEFRRAIELNPNYATAHHWYAYDLFATGRADEAVAEMQRARSLDPFSPIINTDLAEAYFYARRFDDALSQAKSAVALDPSFPLAYTSLERIYLLRQMFPEAVRAAEEAVTLAPADRWMQARLAVALAHAGRKAEAQRILSSLETQSVANGARDDLLLIYAALGDRDRMFADFEKLYANRDGGLILLNCNEDWEPYRSDPRFRDLVRRVGLPPRN
jgi:TolB-like protein/DNA-binding winged helix-turn-helix (wHTH) protein/Tfp pilus assembly protein PilF